MAYLIEYLIIFESGSNISKIGLEAFRNCSLLIAVCIPAKVESLLSCTSLAEMLFEPGTKLTGIDPCAFTDCSSLRSLVIPAHLEILVFDAMWDCHSRCELIFEVPSHLKRLELPPSSFGSLPIPDSVEVVSGSIGNHRVQLRVLHRIKYDQETFTILVLLSLEEGEDGVRSHIVDDQTAKFHAFFHLALLVPLFRPQFPHHRREFLLAAVSPILLLWA
jgi:hypothetical protein